MKKVLYLFVFLLSLFMVDNEVFAWSEYKIGREVEYNGMEFYVIKDSSSEEDSVTLLKAEPLTVEEVNLYLQDISTGINVDNRNNYAGIDFYTSDNCNSMMNDSICESDYSKSIVKIVVDAWLSAKTNIDELSLDDLGYTGRLITIEELENLGYVKSNCGDRDCYLKSDNVPSWLYNNDYFYWWTMSENKDYRVWAVNVGNSGNCFDSLVYNDLTVRPVIVLSKTVLGDIDESVIEENVSEKENNITDKSNNNTVDNNRSKNISSTKVKVENTYLSQSIIIILSGFIKLCINDYLLCN